jgi:hypothetical protein
MDTVIRKGDTYLYQFKARPDENNISFDVALSREDYNLFTDIALQILKPDSSTAFNGGFDLRDARASMTFESNDTESYTLKFRGGLADPEKPHPFRLIIRERREFDSKIPPQTPYIFDIGTDNLFPQQTEYLTIPSYIPPLELPLGYWYYGELTFRTDIGTVRFPVSYSP